MLAMQHAASSSSVDVVVECRSQSYSHRAPDEGRDEGVLCRGRKGGEEGEGEVCILQLEDVSSGDS